jgi:hypothetical protein
MDLGRRVRLWLLIRKLMTSLVWELQTFWAAINSENFTNPPHFMYKIMEYDDIMAVFRLKVVPVLN